MDANFSRRRFLLMSTALGFPALLGLPRAAFAQETTGEPTEEIVIWAPKDGTSIYDGAAILKLAKAAAFFAGGVGATGASIWGAMGVGVGGLAVADPELATKLLLAVLAGALVLEALAMGGLSAVLNFIGADPPRSAYKVPVCKGAVTPPPETVSGFPALNAYSNLLQTATSSARQL